MKSKKNSRRQPLARKYAIEKKARAHKKKLKRVAGKSMGEIQRRDQKKKAMLSIPNKCPFKSDILASIQRKRENRLNEKVTQRKRNQYTKEASSPYESVAEAAKEKQEKFHETPVLSPSLSINERSGNQLKQLELLYRSSDVLAFVLDSRDPLPCRDLRMERRSIADGKKAVLVLNKIDLVPREAVKAWLTYLRQELPTIAFKSGCGTSHQTFTHCKANPVDAPDGLLQNACQVLGADDFIQLLKNYARHGREDTSAAPCERKNGDMEIETECSSGGRRQSASRRRCVTVGVVGCPNVGKSSFINSLRRTPGGARVGGVCGVTKQLQELQLDKQIKLIDSPGVLMSGSTQDPAVVLRSATNFHTVKDPEAVIEYMLLRCPMEQLMQYYKVESFTSASEFLANLARSRGKLGKGGVPDVMAACKLAILEWGSGKIPYFCMPPERVDEHASSCIVPTPSPLN